jgi:transposase
VIVRISDDGEVLETVRVVNDPLQLTFAMANTPNDPEVALEATCGSYWAADLLELEAEGAHVHLVHPLGLHWGSRRVRSDVLDATELCVSLTARTRRVGDGASLHASPRPR